MSFDLTISIGARSAELIGMNIPKNADENYFRNNVEEYRKCYNRSSKFTFYTIPQLLQLTDEELIVYLAQLTDFEIFQSLGIMVGYRSRLELVINSAIAITEESFFIRKQDTDTIGYGAVANYTIHYKDDLGIDFLTSLDDDEKDELLLVIETHIPK